MILVIIMPAGSWNKVKVAGILVELADIMCYTETMPALWRERCSFYTMAVWYVCILKYWTCKYKQYDCNFLGCILDIHSSKWTFKADLFS